MSSETVAEPRQAGVDKPTRRDVIAFRLAAHGLDRRLPAEGLVAAAGRCGVQNSPPGSALLALNARVEGVTQERLDAAVVDRSLLQTWAMRGAPFVFPTADSPVFTAGVLPPTEEARLRLIRGVEPALDAVGASLHEAVELCRAEVGGVLSGRRLAIDELGAEIARRIAAKLSPGRRDVWEAEGPYAAGQPWGEAIVHFCLRILTLQGVVCFAPRAGNKAPFVLVDEWLGHPTPSADPDAARAELLRRYLRCYGPSTRAHFGAWLGVNAGDVGPWWDALADELTPVRFGGRAWVLTEDLAALGARTLPRGARLLPPRDSYTQVRDRETLVNKAFHREVWKTVGEPGTVLVDGEIVGVWRPRKSGAKVTIGVRTFEPLDADATDLLRGEAHQVARLRGGASAEVEFATF